jgi:hypothetical protein
MPPQGSKWSGIIIVLLILALAAIVGLSRAYLEWRAKDFHPPASQSTQ